MEKDVFRRRCLERMKEGGNNRRYIQNKIVTDRLYKLIKKEDQKVIMLYLPMKIEADIMPLIKRLRREGKRLYVPFMEDESFRLVQYRLPLIKRKFGIREPKNSNKPIDKKIDLSIVPVVGIDAALKRVGFGKGMYDRFFEKKKKTIEKILFVSRICCCTRDYVGDHYDVAGDGFISAEKCLFKRNNRAKKQVRI